jgi:hypothetical protein
MQIQTRTLSSASGISVKVEKEKEKIQAPARISNRGHEQDEGKGKTTGSGTSKAKPRTKRQILLAALELGLNEQHLGMLKLLANYQMLTGFQICALSELPQYEYLRPRPRAYAKTGSEYDASYLFDIYSASSGTNVRSGSGSGSGSGSRSTLSRIKNSGGSGSEFSFTKWVSNIRRQQYRRDSKLKEAGFVTTTNHTKGDPAIAVWYITDDGETYLTSQILGWNKGRGSSASVGGGANQFLQLGHTVGVNQVVAGLVLATSEFTNALLRYTYQLEPKAGISNSISGSHDAAAEGEQKGMIVDWNSLYRLETDPFYLQFTSSLPVPALASGGIGTGGAAATATATAPKKTKTAKTRAKEKAAALIYTPDLSGRIIFHSSEPSLLQFALKAAGIADLDNMLLRAATATATVATIAGASASANIVKPTTSSTAPVALTQTKQQQQQASQPPSLSKYLVPDNGFGIISPGPGTGSVKSAAEGGNSNSSSSNNNNEEEPVATAVWPFFLEYDRATEDPAIFAEKAVALTTIFNDRKVWLPEWRGRFPTVLVVVEADSAYLERLIKYTRNKLFEQRARWGDNRPSSWWFTTMAAYEKVFTRTQESYYKFVDQPAKLAASLSNFSPVSVPAKGKAKAKSEQEQGQGGANSYFAARALPSTTPIWLPITARGKPEEMVKHFDDWVRTLVVVGQDPSATKQISVTFRDERGKGQSQSTHTRKALVLDVAGSPQLRNHPQRNYGMVGLPILNFVS